MSNQTSSDSSKTSPPKIVAVFEKLHSDVLDRFVEQGRIQLVYSPPGLDFAALNKWFLQEIQDADAAIVWPVVGPFGEAQIRAANANGSGKFKIVSTLSVGTDVVDLEACRKAGIKVGYTPYVSDSSIAEYTVAMLLYHSRRLTKLQNIVTENRFLQAMEDVVRDPTLNCGFSPEGKTICFYGFGRIAQKTAEKLLPFNPARILYTTSRPNPFTSDSFARLHSLREAFYSETIIENEPDLGRLAAEADVFIILCPGNPSTNASINKTILSRMKSSTVLINVARGSVVVNDDLVDALRNNQIAAALLDVIQGEPHIGPDHPLRAPELQDRVLLLPHAASSVVDARKLMCDVTARNILTTLGFPEEELGDKQALLKVQGWTHFA